MIAGQLPAPAAQILLGGPAGDEADTDAARAQLAAVKQLLADGAAARDARREAAFDARVAAEEAERLACAQQVAEYAKQHGLPIPSSPAASPRRRHVANGIAALPADAPIQNNRSGRL